MPLADDLLEREQRSGSAEDRYDPAQQHYDEQFNNIAKAEEGVDFDQILADNYGDSALKGEKVDSHGDIIQINENATPKDNRDKLKEQEEAGDDGFAYNKDGGSISRGDKLLGRLRGTGLNLGASGSIVGLLLIGVLGVGGGTSILSGSLLINIKELFHNHRADATRSNQLYTRALFSNMFKGEENCKKGAIAKCRMSVMDKSMWQNFKEAGITVKGNVVDAAGQDTGKKVGAGTDVDIGDDEGIKSTEWDFSDGKTKATNGKEVDEIVKHSPDRLRQLENAFASKSAFYLNKFFDKVLSKFHFQKYAKPFPAESDDKDDAKKKAAQDKEFNSSIDPENANDSDSNSRIKRNTDKVTEDVKGKTKGLKVGKGGVIASIIRASCAAYQASYLTIAAVKAYHLAQLGAFALQFFQAADEIKDGKGDSNRVTYLMNNVVAYEKNKFNADGSPNPKFNLSGPDAEGYKIATHGDKSGLKDFSKKFMLGGDNAILSTAQTISDSVGGAVDKLPILEGRTQYGKVKQLCRLATGGPAAIATQCFGTLAALESVGSSVPAVGNAIAGAISADFCACAVNSITPTIGKVLQAPLTAQCKALEWVIDKMTSFVIDKIVGSSIVKDVLTNILKDLNVDSNLKGVDSVNAIAAGAGLMLSTTATGYGMRPASSKNKNKEISDYITYTQPIEDQYIALDKDDAKHNPLDPNNQYSIIGSIVRALNPTNHTAASDGTTYGLFSTIAGIYTTSLGILTNSQPAYAAYNQPSQAAGGASGLYDHCKDEALEELGASADPYCSIVAVNSVEELQSAQEDIDNPDRSNLDTLIDYMTHDQEGTKCTGLSASFAPTDETKCSTSGERSISDDYTPNPNSQYQMFLTYCGEDRKSYWGTQFEGLAEGADRDQDWYSGKACMYDVDSPSSAEGTMVRNFRMWKKYCLINGTMKHWLNCYDKGVGKSATAGLTAGKGDACSLLNNPNIIFVGPAIGIPGGKPGDGTKQGLKEICEKGSSTNSCGQDGYTLNQELLNIVTTLSSKYKVWLNNFGFKYDRDSCDSGQHPKGGAVDLNGIEKLDGSGRAGGPDWGGITYGDPKQVAVINDYASDWLMGIKHNHGGVGQQGCSSSFHPRFPPDAVNVNGAAFFPDSCNHLHIDVRDRGGVSAL